MEKYMETQIFEPRDVVNFAAAKDAAKLSTAFDQMIGQRVQDAIQARKIEVAKQMFAAVEDEAETEINDPAEQEQQDASAEGEESTEISAEQQTDQNTEESDETAQQNT